MIHAVYFVTDYMSFPFNLEIRYGCHPLFIPPVFQRSPFVDTSYGYEQMYERIPELVPGSMPYGVQRSVVRGPVNRIYRAPDILVSCPADEHIGQSVLEKVLAILDAADSPMACYMAHKSWRLSQIENDSWLTMTSYFADEVLYWKDQALYPYCMRYVNGKLELLEKAKEERKHYRKTDQEEHQRLLDLRSAFSDEMPTEYMARFSAVIFWARTRMMVLQNMDWKQPFRPQNISMAGKVEAKDIRVLHSIVPVRASSM